MSQDLIRQTSDHLKRAIVGTRFWFCLWPEADRSAARLLLTQLQRDPGQREMSSLIAANKDAGGRILRGIATAGPDGKLVFGGVGLQRDDLYSLADWVKEHSYAHDGLCLLGGSIFLKLDRNGKVLEHIDVPRSWSVANARPIPGSPQSAAFRLEKLQSGASVWFWMTDRAQNGKPALVLERSTRDKKMTRLMNLVRGLRGGGREAFGTLRRSQADVLAFITSSSVKDASSILASLTVAYPEQLAALRTAQIARTADGGLAETGAAPPIADLNSTVATLTALKQPTDKAWFVYTRQSNGSSTLHVAEDRGAVQPMRALAANAGHDCLSGSVQRNNAGWLLFQSRATRSGFIDELAGWARQHSHRLDLSCLRGARYAVRADQGAITHREKNDNVWTFLN